MVKVEAPQLGGARNVMRVEQLQASTHLACTGEVHDQRPPRGDAGSAFEIGEEDGVCLLAPPII